MWQITTYYHESVFTTSYLEEEIQGAIESRLQTSGVSFFVVRKLP